MATIDAKSFLALEKSLASRLITTWTELSSSLIEEITGYIRKGDYTSAIILAEGIDLAPLVEKERDYIRYITNASLLFGASRITEDVQKTAIFKVKMDAWVEKAVTQLSRMIERNVEDHVRSRLLKYIADASNSDPTTNYSPSDFVFKGDFPGHPFRGNQYTDGVGSGVSWRDAKPDWTPEMKAMWEQVKDLPTDSPDPTNQKFRAMIEDVRNREREWKRQMDIAISMGEIPIKEAYAKGFFPQSYSADDVKPLPQVLFHVTTAYDKVVESGLKSRDELNQQSGAGLGGGPSDTISFSTDKDTAEGIHKGILFARDFAAGTVTPKDLVEWSRTGHEGSKPFFKHLNDPYEKATQKDLFPGTDLTIPLYDTLHGTNTREFLKTMVKDGVVHAFGMSGKDWEGAKVTVVEDRGDVVLVQAKATPKQIADRNERLFKHFMTWRENYGGPLDPLFFSSDLKGLANIPKDQIRLLQFKPKPNTFGHAASGLSEWRVLTGATVELDRVIKDALVRKFNPNHDPETGRFTWKDAAGVSYDSEKKTWVSAKGHAVSKEIHDRLKELKIPPGWTNVRLNPDPKGELQAVGTDSKGNEQPKYSAEHTKKADAEKFRMMQEFNKQMPEIDKALEQDIKNRGLSSRERDVVAIARLMRLTAFRIGGEKTPGTAHTAIGARTIKGQHVKLDGDKLIFSFTAKSGVKVNKTITDSLLADYIRSKNPTKGERVFPDVTETEINQYIKRISGNDWFSAKDFRTWWGTGIALKKVKELGPPKDSKSFKKKLKEVLKSVSNFLGNTPSVALNKYVDPAVFKPWSVDSSWLLKGHAVLLPVAKAEISLEEIAALMDAFLSGDPYVNYGDWKSNPELTKETEEDGEEVDVEGVFKFNPYHDEKGRFTDASSEGSNEKAISRGVPKHLRMDRVPTSELKRYSSMEAAWVRESEKAQAKFEDTAEAKPGVKYDAVLEGEKVSDERSIELLRFGGSLQKFVAEKGVPMPVPDSPPEIKLGKMKSCFENAAKVIMYGQFDTGGNKYKYVEGYVVMPKLGIPIHHAWLQDQNGKVVDPTLGWQPKASYIGVAYSQQELFRSLNKNRVYGLFIGPTGRPTELVTIVKDEEDRLLFLYSSELGVPLSTSDLVAIRTVQKAEIVRPFVSFADNVARDGYNRMQLISTLHTSRLSAFGFTVEADVTGLSRYEISEQLDNKVCPVCEIMDGKEFDVSDAQELLQKALTADDPMDLATIQPWPEQNKEAIEELRGMDEEELVARGWNVPPFHPFCRGLLVPVGKGIDITETPSYRAAFGKPLAAIFGGEALAAAVGITTAEVGIIGELVAGKSGKDAIDIWNELKKTYDVAVLEEVLGITEADVLAGKAQF